MSRSLGIFAAYGIEMEYMIVDQTTLLVRPIADQILKELNGGTLTDEVELGEIAVSNELVLHVIEFKCQGPQTDFSRMHTNFHATVHRVNKMLKKHNAMLLPSAMHPTMNPDRDMKLWPHGNSEIYATYNRIFDCRGHGWSNLQSIHINLPFANDDEFGRLHAAIRVLLPLLPAIAASSPIVEGKLTGWADNRLEFYRQNQKKIPSITGHVIPEAAFTKKDYEDMILNRCYQDILPFDPQEILRDEWLNSRGAIARFQRDAIEIRVLDIQECPKADFAIITAVVSVLKNLVAENISSYNIQKTLNEKELEKIFIQSSHKGLDAEISDQAYLHCLGISDKALKARDLWQMLLSALPQALDESKAFKQELQYILHQGNLSQRIQRQLREDGSIASIDNTYHRLARCLEDNQLF